MLSKFDFSSFSMTGNIKIFKLVILLIWSSSKIIVDDFRQVIIDLEFGQILLRQVTVILLSLRNTLVHKKQFQRKKIQETHIGPGLSHFQWFGQEESRTGWVLQSINRFQKLSLLFLSVTRFFDLCHKIKNAW